MVEAAQDPVARQAFLEWMNEDENWRASTINKANLYMYLGERELAMQSLVQAREEGDPYSVTGNRMAIFDPLMDDPRFVEHLRAMNIER